MKFRFFGVPFFEENPGIVLEGFWRVFSLFEPGPGAETWKKKEKGNRENPSFPYRKVMFLVFQEAPL